MSESFNKLNALVDRVVAAQKIYANFSQEQGK